MDKIQIDYGVMMKEFHNENFCLLCYNAELDRWFVLRNAILQEDEDYSYLGAYI